ncbi:InlB B-repeat-containing protein [Bifidobacterium sp. W8117]|nr:InlB B-repeat-containing protein [Bifidobacterium polysaccharolyticum]
MPALRPASLLWPARARLPQQETPGGGGRQTPRVAKQNPGTFPSKAKTSTTPITPESPLAKYPSLNSAKLTPRNHLQTRSSVEYSVIFTDPEGGNSTFSQNVNDGNQAIRPTNPSRNGYLFDGWFICDTSGESKVAYDFSQPVTGKTVLAAHWTKQSNTWSLNPDSGPITGNTTVNITPPDHSRGIRFNQVSAGGEQPDVIGFSVGVASDGNAYAWGNNKYGQLGQDPAETTAQNTPTKVPLPNGVAAGFTYTQVAAGGAHTLAIGSNGILYSWGRNDHGQLGDGTTTDRYKPQPVNVASNQPFKAVQVSAGAYDSAAIDDQGRVYTWGCEHNSYSTYGTAKLVPTLAKDPNGSSQGLHAVQVSAKWSFLLALDEDGSVYAWGYNTNGQLGNGTATGDGNADYANDPKPVQDPKDANKTFKATQISAGTRHALAIGREDGSLYTWGKVNDTNYTRPTNDPTNTGKTIKATQISAGTWHSLAIDQDGNAWGWGWNQYGQTGNGNTNSQGTPTKVTGPNNTGQGFKAVCVSAAHNHSLAIGQDGNTYAWGKNDYSQLGNTSIPTTGNSPTPIQTMFDPTPLNITNVKFDKTAVDHLVQNSDGSVTLATPTHNPGLADVIVDWTLGGVIQTQAHLAYTYEGTLPLTGGNGSMILLLAAGMLATAGAAAAGRHRRETHALHV